jgi:5-methylcytosine-specific restriction endonuclease McrA
MECATVGLARVRIHPRDVGCARRLARWFACNDCVPAQDRQVDIQGQVCSRADSFHCRNFGLVSLALTIQATSIKNKHLTAKRSDSVHIFMSDILNKTIVLVLNRNWQAINIRTPQDAFCQMATNVATALEIDGKEHIRPVTWNEWITLPIRDGDNAVRTVRGAIRVPTVIVAVNFAKVPKKRPKLCARTIRERDGNRCQYTGALLRPDEGSLDHVVPRSRGGPDTWENLVWSSKQVNTRKGNRLPHEAGLKLLKAPRAPKELPVSALIRNAHGVAEWKLFLNE